MKLTVVDRFSKMLKFIALPKLPSAKETVGVVLNNIFCQLLGATVGLSSGFHPQTNGQTEGFNQDLEMGL